MAWRSVWAFLGACTPSLEMVAVAGPLSLIVSSAALWFAGWLKQRRRLATGYSRKVFHLLVFASVSCAQLIGGLPLVCVFGAMTTLVLGYTVMRGDGHPFYEALAREADAPRRTYYIVTPYVATLVGGLLSNLLSGRAALIGYLVCGLGDAAGEPVGTRWGRHWYTVPALRGSATARRSLEGSAGVFIVSVAAVCLGVAALAGARHVRQTWAALLAVALASTLVEAVSPHGWDNATMQLVPSLLAAALLLG
jgi:phytol kinase